MHFFRAIPWHLWSRADLEGNENLMIAVLAVILLWLAFDHMPLTVKYK